MTKQEAAEMISNDIRLHHDYLSGTYRKALKMAVDALKQPEVVQYKNCKYYPDGEGATGYVPCRETVTQENWFCGCVEPKN